MSNLANVLTSIDESVLTVTVNRPDAMNALSAATLSELRSVFTEASADDAIGAVVLTGSETGKKPAFAAGADIKEMAPMTGLELREHSRQGQACMAAIETCSSPVIAAINGMALGGGLELALACHIRIAAEGVLLGQPEINLGIITGFGGSQRLPRLIGRGQALQMLLTGKPISAERGCELGLINEVVSADVLLATAGALALEMASKAPIARALLLDAVCRGADRSPEDAMALEADLFGIVGATLDVKEGLNAFIERRDATFEGR